MTTNGHFSINSPNGKNHIALPCDFQITAPLWVVNESNPHPELHINGTFTLGAPTTTRHFVVVKNGVEIDELLNKEPKFIGLIQHPTEFTVFTIYETKEP